MRNLLPSVLAMAVLACSRESTQTRPSAAPTTVTADKSSSAAVDTPTASSSPAAIPPGYDTANAPFDTLGNLLKLTARDSLCGDLVENGLAIPNERRKDIAIKFGRPDSTHSVPTPNKYNSAQTDSTVEVFYPSLRLHYIVLGVREGETDILYRADVSSNRYLKYPSLGIGASRDAIVKAIGEPELRPDGAYRYECALHVMAGVTLFFYFDGERVKLAEYWFYVD